MEASETLAPLRVLGLMSGTSADGVDAVLARFAPAGGRLAWEVVARHSQAYAPELRARLLAAMKPETSDVVALTQLHTEVGEVYAGVARAVQAAHPVDLVALSGQTVYHIPRVEARRGWRTRSTLQLGEAAFVAEGCGLPVVADFRQSDMAAGGQGAPMVSFGDLQLFAERGRARAVHNLGGISNLTFLPASGDPEEVFAFDTGPASCLIDEAAKRDFGLDFDDEGALAARGEVDEAVLASLLAHPYFEQGLPKTTGREVFTLSEFAVELEGLEGHDLLATLTALTAESVARAYRDFVPPVDDILVAGGGAHNRTLMAGLRARLGGSVRSFEEVGWQSRDREALAFAVMAYYAWHGLPNTLPKATGARRAVVAGKLLRPWRGPG